MIIPSIIIVVFLLGLYLGFLYGVRHTRKQLHVISGKSAKKFYKDTGLGEKNE